MTCLVPFGSFEVSKLETSWTAVFVSNGHRLSTLGAADLLVFHIESFCIHTAVLILTKGVLVSRSSRLIADKRCLVNDVAFVGADGVKLAVGYHG